MPRRFEISICSLSSRKLIKLHCHPKQTKIKTLKTTLYPHFIAGEIWAGWDDEKEDGNFQNPNTGDSLSNLDLWYAGEPNGGSLENCAIVWVPRKAWNDLKCDHTCHGFCYIKPRPRTKLRGSISPNNFFFIIE